MNESLLSCASKGHLKLIVKSDSYVYCGVEMQNFSKKIFTCRNITCAVAKRLDLFQVKHASNVEIDHKFYRRSRPVDGQQRVLYTEGSAVANDRITALASEQLS
jgi:hypothetical protein